MSKFYIEVDMVKGECWKCPYFSQSLFFPSFCSCDVSGELVPHPEHEVDPDECPLEEIGG